MTEERNDKYWILDDYKQLIYELPEDCEEQKIKDIFEKIPIKAPTSLVNSVMELIISQTNHGKRNLNKIYKEQYQTNLINQLQGEQFEHIKYDDNIIQIGKDEIYLLQIRGINIKRIIIASFSLKILYKAIDKERNNIEYYTFYSNNELFYSYEVNEFLGIYKDKLFKGDLSRNVIRFIFSEKSKTIPIRKAVYINGYDNKWYTSINDKESNFMIICYTQEQRDILNSVRKAYKKYSTKEKTQLCQMLNNFINITTFNQYYLTITAAWSIISLFKLYFIDNFKIFPHLGMEGDRSTAKSAIMDTFINDIWGIYEVHLSGNSADSIARAENFVTAGTYPIYIDELEVTIKAFLSMLKEMAGARSYYIRMKPDLTQIKKAKVASISMSSNTGYLKEQFGDLANNSKAIILNPKKPIKRNAEWVKLALKIKEGKYFSLLYDHTKDWTNKDLDKLVKETEKEFNINDKIKELGDDKYVTKNYPRLKEIYTIILAGVLLFEKIFGIRLKIDNKILKILVESRGYILSELVNYFISFCKKAKEYFYNEIDSEGKTIAKNRPRYLNHELKVNNKGWGLFGVDNLKDFKQFTEMKFRGLEDLCNQVIEGLQPENKGWLFIHDTSYKGESLRCIKVSPEILDYNIWDIEEPREELSFWTDEEMKEKEEDESVELDFDELEFEDLEVDVIDKKDTDDLK